MNLIMNLKNIKSFTVLSKSKLKLIKAGGDPPDCSIIPKNSLMSSFFTPYYIYIYFFLLKS